MLVVNKKFNLYLTVIKLCRLVIQSSKLHCYHTQHVSRDARIDSFSTCDWSIVSHSRLRLVVIYIPYLSACHTENHFKFATKYVLIVL